MNYPSWATPKRRRALARLAVCSANRCLQGHPVCPIAEHYVAENKRLFTVAANVVHQYVDDDGQRVTVEGVKLTTAVVTTKTQERLYDRLSEELIAEWKAYDRTAKAEAARQEGTELHHCFDDKGWGCRFDPAAKDVFFAQQPSHYVEGMGINPLTFHKTAKIRVSSSPVRLFVDCHKLSYNARKYLRRRKGIIAATTEEACQLAAEHYKASLA